MAEPLLPHPSDDETVAAEPGPGGPEPEAPEEPDVDSPRPQQEKPEQRL